MKKVICRTGVIWFLLASASVGGDVPPPDGPPAAPAAEETEPPVETFVLTPIRIESCGAIVPAEVYGPITNNSCRAWESHVESCYLPARRLDAGARPTLPEAAALIEGYLSAFVGAWKPGAWPADGASVDVPIGRYASMEHLWLTHRVVLAGSVGACWLDGQSNPEPVLDKAATQPAAAVEIELFAGTRNAAGYPFVFLF